MTLQFAKIAERFTRRNASCSVIFLQSEGKQLQAAAAASGERQQQRREALCKLANQA
jgi:hypothetical protein